MLFQRDQHVPVADRCLEDVDAGGSECVAQTEVRHHSDGDRIVVERPAFGQIDRERDHHLVAVDDFTVLVDRDDTIGVTVEREPDVGRVRAHGRDEGLRAKSSRSLR